MPRAFVKCAFTFKKSIFSEFVFTTGVVATKATMALCHALRVRARLRTSLQEAL